MTLDELKEQNAREEQEALEQETPTEVEENADVQEVENDEEENAHEEGQENADEETHEVSEPESELPLYLQTEGDEAKFTDSDVANVRRKFKARLSDKDDEIEALKAENERLKQSPQTAPQQVEQMPKLEDFDYDDEKHAVAMEEWREKKFEAKLLTKQREQQLQAQQEQQKRELKESLEAHYSRASQLAAKGEMAQDKFEAAERVVRESINSAIGNGDDVADAMINVIGEGSEKVIAYLGINAAKRYEFVNLLKTNNIKATMYLGELKAKLNQPAKKLSRAPKPSAQLKAETASATGEAALKAKYKNAKSAQERFKLSREGRKQGFNTHNW